jgi:hypothetical protein
MAWLPLIRDELLIPRIRIIGDFLTSLIYRKALFRRASSGDQRTCDPIGRMRL